MRDLRTVATATAEDVKALEAAALRNAQTGGRAVARRATREFEDWVVGAERAAPRLVFSWTKEPTVRPNKKAKAQP